MIAIANEDINKLLGVTESYQAPQKMLSLMLDVEERPNLFNAFLGREKDVGYEWFQSYFEDEHSDRREKKQDFTPHSVSALLSEITESGTDDNYFEAAAGTGGILIQHWYNKMLNESPMRYDPREHWHKVEELSDRAIPFLIFNMSIRGMNGVILHGDSLTREFKAVYFIRNDTPDFLKYSEVIKMPRTEQLEKECNILKWI